MSTEDKIYMELENIQRIVSPFSKLMKNTLELDLGLVKKPIDSLTKLLKNCEIGEVEEAEIKNNTEKWAKYGFCLPLNNNLSILTNPPTDKKADRLFREIFNEKQVEALKRDLIAIKVIKKSDMQQALIFFNQKKYKFCSMLLFSFIDRVVILAQPTTIDRELPNRASEIKDIELKNSKLRQFIVIFYEVVNLLKAHYKRANNFTNEEEFTQINRNFVMHGVSDRKITKKDCIKLMQLLVCTEYVFWGFKYVGQQ